MESTETTKLIGNEQRNERESLLRKLVLRASPLAKAFAGAVMIVTIVLLRENVSLPSCPGKHVISSIPAIGTSESDFHRYTGVELSIESTVETGIKTPSNTSVFPTNFLWGAATSAYQIEGGFADGGRGLSIWDTWCVESNDHCHGDTGDVADDHYHRWRDDVELMKNLRLKAYRFSISWSRILPNGTVDYGDDLVRRLGGNAKIKGINYEGIRFYNNMIDALLDANIEPFVTLYHWDLPQALQDKYDGWVNRSIIEDFGDYARICFYYFGDRVKYWITINEGWTIAIHGYEEGSNAPGFFGENVGGSGKPYLVGHHLLLAHARAVRVFREEGYAQRYRRGGYSTDDNNHSEYGMIGISNSGDFRFPLNVGREDDLEAATRAMEFQLGWMVRLSKCMLH